MKAIYSIIFSILIISGCKNEGKTPREADGYFTIEISGKTWLAENLNVEVAESYCYNDDSNFCKIYGRLYTWDGAKKACAKLGEYWRLPTQIEWDGLIRQFGGQGSEPNSAYDELLEGGISGFNAKLGGRRGRGGGFAHIDEYGTYWSGTEIDSFYVWRYGFTKRVSMVGRGKLSKQVGRSCRCIMDSKLK